MLLNDLIRKNLLKPPAFLEHNTHYLTVMGSYAYATNDASDKSKPSDFDIYGFAIPPKEHVFPHLANCIQGFGTQIKSFQQYQQHHVFDQDALAGKGREYDFTIFSIVKYFDLLMDANPNILDSIFTSQECVLHITEVGNMVRENRKMFLTKKCFPKFKGYSYSQLHKMTTKEPEGKRKEYREIFGFDVKFGMHVVRLLSEVEQILIEGNLDLRKNREQLKAIRRGEMSEEEIRRWASEKEQHLEKIYVESNLPDVPDEEAIKKLLLQCLEHHYGSLDKCISNVDWSKDTLRELDTILDKVRKNLY